MSQLSLVIVCTWRSGDRPSNLRCVSLRSLPWHALCGALILNAGLAPEIIWQGFQALLCYFMSEIIGFLDRIRLLGWSRGWNGDVILWLGFLWTDLSLVARGGAQALGKKITSQTVVVHILVTYVLAFVCLFVSPHKKKKLFKPMLNSFFCQSGIAGNFKFIQTKEFELVFG